MTPPRRSGEQWLSAALSGGLPEPARHRWQPLRVGIVNLWEYSQDEFWFADGRLVLRGGNGAGKTKVLELTTLMLLRGEVGPTVLDPFGSQSRTMRFNLLPTGEPDDPRPPADSSSGYAWAEFGRIDETGEPRYFVLGLGVSARRGSGTGSVTTWHLITPLRPGSDLRLLAAGRPIDRGELKKITGVTVPDGARSYRAQVAAELFGLDPDAYDNLTALLKQLRKPKLGERLDPTSLAETLRAALPPLANAEVDQLAHGWENLERLRAAVDETRHAARQLAVFVRTGWKPWAQTVVRRRADALSRATTGLDDTTKKRRAAESSLDAAAQQVEELGRCVTEAGTAQQHHEIELRELLESPAYQEAADAVRRVDDLGVQFRAMDERCTAAERRRAVAEKELSQVRANAEAAAEKVRTADLDADRASDVVREAAPRAGLRDSADRYLPPRDLAALLVDHSKRRERFARLRELHHDHERAEREVATSAGILADRAEMLTDAAEEQEAAYREVTTTVDTLRGEIREWNATATSARADEATVEEWCELVADLTSPPRDAEPSRSPAAEIAHHIAGVRDHYLGQRQHSEHELSAVTADRDTVAARLDEVSTAAVRTPEAPAGWRRRDRPASTDDQGAPLWECVRPVAGASAVEVDMLEASLAASGLLDAWIHPDGGLSPSAGGLPVDTLVLGGAERPSNGLTAVLEPTPVGGVPASTIRSVLAAIGWFDTRPADDGPAVWLAADGTWRCAALTGRAEPVQPASYLGATAREAARRREEQRLRARLAELDSSITEWTERIDAIDGDLHRLAGERDRAPRDRMVTDAVSTWRERERQVERCRQEVTRAEETHRRSEAGRDQAWATFSGYASEHAFPVRDLAAHEEALRDYQQALKELKHRLELLSVHTGARSQVDEELTSADTRFEDVTAELEKLRGEQNQIGIKLAAAQRSLTTDDKEKLDRRGVLDTALANIRADLVKLNADHSEARGEMARAEEVLDRHEAHRKDAEQQRDTALESWWEVFDIGLAQPIGFAEPERRTVESARDSMRAARRELPEAADQDRRWRACQDKLTELRQILLPDRDAKVLESGSAGAPPRIVVLVDSASGWQQPTAAEALLTDQAQEQEGSFDAEQQRVLTTLLGSTFIEHLKDRLDYTRRTFTDINDQLAGRSTRYGSAVRLRWTADPTDPDSGTVVDALSQGYQQLSPARQDQVRSFLSRRIDRARSVAADTGSGDWREQLSEALDYRSWLKISLEYQPGSTARWVPFDAAKHGSKSGGEKVVLLSHPLFAAAVVAYNAADAQAPRCVWLDEAMTGVDEEIKASFMGLTVDFDLDVMLTAHDEWCRYSTVPAVAVYDLARHKGFPGVDSIPYLWRGGEWTAVAVPGPGRSAEEEASLAEGLFADEDEE
ncbi:TIGR02680 family protein [Saccharopolyspora sp. NFXS83]|uniref:TIGR02680 family protein n=1 Tax=Saccharopolyspora sp. NFXS83 TaxID=2993560 RepID=UPI00224B8EC4|nr:TIGR02680 family protein [Saccharopolyspora sp. NFXS83]MCX2730670.1 TIGR02680 family protein [Saccharopolyspora sp. NFXS83]